jgi:hypothetical protein
VQTAVAMAEPTITLQDGTVLKVGDDVLVLNSLRRWTVTTIKEIIPGVGVEKAVCGNPFGIRTRYQLRARKKRAAIDRKGDSNVV